MSQGCKERVGTIPNPQLGMPQVQGPEIETEAQAQQPTGVAALQCWKRLPELCDCDPYFLSFE